MIWLGKDRDGDKCGSSLVRTVMVISVAVAL